MYRTMTLTVPPQIVLPASIVSGPPPDKRLSIDECSDVTMLTKPIIYINVKEICSTHSSCESECAYVYICSSYLNLLAYLRCVL